MPKLDDDWTFRNDMAETIPMTPERRRQLLMMTDLGRRYLADAHEPPREAEVRNVPQPTLPSPSVGLSTGRPVIVQRDVNSRFRLQATDTSEIRRLGAVTVKGRRFVRQGRKPAKDK